MPIVIRGPQGGGHRLGAQHSQSLEAWFVSVPGLKVVMPSTASDAKGLLLAAVRDPNPVLFLEHKNLYQLPRSAVPSGDYEIALGVADIKRAGTDVTVVATSNMVHEALKAARRLQRQGVSLEVIDPRTLWPLDESLILQSVRKTSRLVIAHEAPRRGGWGAELLSIVQESRPLTNLLSSAHIYIYSLPTYYSLGTAYFLTHARTHAPTY
jgi:pyruvate/2-oxoglutarate/acetoin dehydrogenase E1 component